MLHMHMLQTCQDAGHSTCCTQPAALSACPPPTLQEMSNYQKRNHISSPPGLLEYLGYVLCLGNLLAGPFFEFSDYQQWIYSTGVGTMS